MKLLEGGGLPVVAVENGVVRGPQLFVLLQVARDNHVGQAEVRQVLPGNGKWKEGGGR